MHPVSPKRILLGFLGLEGSISRNIRSFYIFRARKVTSWNIRSVLGFPFPEIWERSVSKNIKNPFSDLLFLVDKVCGICSSKDITKLYITMQKVSTKIKKSVQYKLTSNFDVLWENVTIFARMWLFFKKKNVVDLKKNIFRFFCFLFLKTKFLVHAQQLGNISRHKCKCMGFNTLTNIVSLRFRK